jgi:hypothetical protein
MKKITIYIFAFSLLALYACKKDHTAKTTDTNAVHNVKFNVADFSVSSGPFKINSIKTTSTSSHDTLTKYASVFYFLIYDASGKRITTIKQQASQADFGTFTAQLKAGSYTVDIAAGGTGFNLLANTNPTLTTDAFNYLDDIGQVGYTKDTFFKQVLITVTTTDSNYNTSLDRITAILNVNIEDPVPAGAHVLQMTVYNNAQLSAMGVPITPRAFSFEPDPALDVNADPYKLVPGSTNNKVSTILFASTTANPASIKLWVADIVFDADGTPYRVFANKTITANLLANKTNLVTGNLFGTFTGSGFTVKYDTTWNAAPLHYGF